MIHGKLNSDHTAKCDEGWSGDGCETRSCLNECNKRGQCTEEGECLCLPGYTGKWCEILNCPQACSGHGKCLETAKCECHQGYRGVMCEERFVKNGFIKNGVVICLEGWEGSACQN